MSNEVIEYFVKGRRNKKLPIILTAVALGLFIIDFLIFTFFGILAIPFVVILTAFGIYLINFLVKYNKLEFEYSVFSSDFEINEIRNQAKRKPVLKCRISDIQNFKKILRKDFDEKRIYKAENTTYFYCFGDDDEVLYGFTVRGEDGENKQVYVAHVDRIMERLSAQNYEIRKTL